MRRIPIILFLLFMFFAFVCCESRKEAMTHEIEQQKRAERLRKQNAEDRQRHFMYTRTSTAGRYEIFQRQQFAKNTFLLDAMDGRVWVLVEDQETKELSWEELAVENLGPYTKYD